MRRSARVVLGGQSWTIKRVRKIRDKGEECFGLCDPNTRTVFLEESLSGPKFLRFALHEMLHAQIDMMDEEYVDRFSVEMSDALVKIGFFEHE